MLGSLARLFLGPLTSWIQQRGRLKEARVLAEIRRLERAAEAEVSYDVEAQRQRRHTVLDEFLALILIAPFVAGFWPDDRVQAAISLGWDSLGKAPWWYQALLIGVYAATFGLRWLFQGRYRLTGREKDHVNSTARSGGP